MARIYSLLVGIATVFVAAQVQAAAPRSFTSRSNRPGAHELTLTLTPSLLARHSPAFTRRGGETSTTTTIDTDPSEPAVVIEASESQLPKKISLSTRSAVIAGCTLAFNSGYINGICLSGLLSNTTTKQAAAAVTGAWTNSALGAATGNMQQFAFNAKCIGSYCGGSLIASLLNPNPVPFEIDVNRVSPAFLIASLLMYSSSRVAKNGGGDNRSFIFLAAIACGIQNSITSVLTSNLVRSAHFSGITSDIGTFLGQVLRGNDVNALKLKVFSALALSFWTGGYVSYSTAKAYASSSLLFGSAVFLLVALGLLIV